MSLENLRFRAWDKEEKEWLSIRTIGFYEDGSLYYLQAWDDNENDIDPPYFEDDLGVKWELLQSTGLKDKNDTEIFEGDILKYWGECRPVVSHEASFGWIEGGYYIPFPMMCISEISNTEVIGNIYENEDLLK